MTGKLFPDTINELELMERRLLTLTATKANQPVGITRLFELTELPQHKVRYSLRLLEKDGLIIATQKGAGATDFYDEFMDRRHLGRHHRQSGKYPRTGEKRTNFLYGPNIAHTEPL